MGSNPTLSANAPSPLSQLRPPAGFVVPWHRAASERPDAGAQEVGTGNEEEPRGKVPSGPPTPLGGGSVGSGCPLSVSAVMPSQPSPLRGKGHGSSGDFVRCTVPDVMAAGFKAGPRHLLSPPVNPTEAGGQPSQARSACPALGGPATGRSGPGSRPPEGMPSGGSHPLKIPKHHSDVKRRADRAGTASSGQGRCPSLGGKILLHDTVLAGLLLRRGLALARCSLPRCPVPGGRAPAGLPDHGGGHP